MELLYGVRTKQKRTIQRRMSWLNIGRHMVRVVPSCWRKSSDIWRLCVLSGDHNTTILSFIHARRPQNINAQQVRSTLSFGSRGHKAVGGNLVSWNRYGIVRGLRGSTLYQTAERRKGKTKNRNVFWAALIGRPTMTDVYAEWQLSLWNVRVYRGKKSSSRETNERKSRWYPARPVRDFTYKNTIVSHSYNEGGGSICSKKSVNFRRHCLYYIQ